jgi:hypothetical protein
MRFILESRQVEPQDIVRLNEKMLDIDWSDYSQLDEQLNDLLALEQNFQKFGMTDAVMDLVGPSLEAWNIKLDSVDACMESMWDKVKEVSKKIWDAIVATIKRIGQFFKNLFDRRKKLSAHAGKVDQLEYKGTKSDNGAAQEAFEDNPKEFIDKKFFDIVTNKVQIPYDYYAEMIDFCGEAVNVAQDCVKALDDFAKNPGTFGVELAKRKIETASGKLSKFKHLDEFISAVSLVRTEEDDKSLGALGYKYATFFKHTISLSTMQENLNNIAAEASKTLDACNKRLDEYEKKQTAATIKTTEYVDMQSVKKTYQMLFNETRENMQAALRRSSDAAKIMVALDNIAIRILKSNGIEVFTSESNIDNVKARV